MTLPTPCFYEGMSAINMHGHNGFLQGDTTDLMKTEAVLLCEQEFLESSCVCKDILKLQWSLLTD